MKINNRLVFPELVFHGTVLSNLEGFKNELVNPNFWNHSKDFGGGLYTTISLEQAKKWAIKFWVEFPWETPCVLNIRCMPEKSMEDLDSLIFLGDCREWSDYILEHRTRATKEFDPCDSHPDIIVGPMADNDTGKVVEIFKEARKDRDWFFKQICLHKENNQRLDGLELGNQVVFCNRKTADILQLIGYYEYNKKIKEWLYNETSNSV